MKHYLRFLLILFLTSVCVLGGQAQTWKKVNLDQLTSGDVFVIAEIRNAPTAYAISNDKGTTAPPSAVKITLSSDGTKITSSVAENLKWNLSVDENNKYTFYPNGVTDKWLYCTNTNNGVRVGINDDNKFEEYSDGNKSWLKNIAQSRYVGLYTTQDWRCYKTATTTNIANNKMAYYKYEDTSLIGTNVTFGSDVDGKTFDVNEGTTFEPKTAYEKDNVAGSITYSSSKSDIVKVDETDGTLTFGTSFGEATIQATFTPNDKTKYKVSTIYYTINYIEKQKTPTTLSFPQQSFVFSTLDYDSFTGQKATLTSNGSELTDKSITYSNNNADIFTSFNGEDGTFQLNGKDGTATVTATFVTDGIYASAIAEYTISVKYVVKDIATLKNLVTITSSTKAQPFTLKLTDAIVTYKNGDNIYIQDATGGLYCTAKNLQLATNDKINGLVDVKIFKNNGQRQVNSWTMDAGATIEHNAEFMPTVVTVKELNDNINAYENMRVRIVSATAQSAFSSNQMKVAQDGSYVTVYDKASLSGWEIVADDIVDIEGYPCTYNNTKEVCVWTLQDVSVNNTAVKTTLKFDNSATAFTVYKGKEQAFVSPKAIVTDVDGNTIEEAIVKYDSSNKAVATVAEDGTVQFIACGNTTVTASYNGDDTHKAAPSVTYSIVYSKMPTIMKFSADELNAVVGQEEISAPVLSLTADGVDILQDKTITYESSDEDVAICVDGEIMIGDKEGTATITATFVGDDTYEANSASYTIVVSDPAKLNASFDFSNPSKYGFGTTSGSVAYGQGDGDIPEGTQLKEKDVTWTYTKHAGLGTRFYSDGLRAYANTSHTLSVPAGYRITSVSFEFGNKSKKNYQIADTDANTDWTGEARKVDIMYSGTTSQIVALNVGYKKVELPTVTLTEGDNDETVMENDKVSANVVVERSLIADGGWYTLFLPFDVENVAETPLKNAAIRKFSSMSGTTMNFEPTTSLSAWHAYLVKPTEDVVKPTFEDVTINLESDGSVDDGSNGYKFTGDISAHKLKCDGTELFLGADNKFYMPTPDDCVMKALRGYFVVPEGTAVAMLSIRIDGQTAGVAGLECQDHVNGKVYNLNGQQVADGTEKLAKGIYIVNGKKLIIK